MEYQQAFNKLEKMGQEHLLEHWQAITPTQQRQLLEQIVNLDEAIFLQQREVHVSPPVGHLQPFLDYANIGNKREQKQGQRLISEGQVGCLLIAGGQGTRLRFNGPKGCFPITVIKHKTLFQLYAEKVIAASNQAGRPLPLAIMTSPINHKETVHFFQEHHFFGLHPEQLSIFSQEMLPFLDQQNHLFLEESYKIAEGPDGNGSSLKHFVEKGVWKKWNKMGVRYVNFVLIDNPLAEPFDAELIGFHVHENLDITVKCTIRRDEKEKVGMLVHENEKTRVIEYTELPDQERTERLPDGSLKHKCANISLFCFSMDFIEKNYSVNLPLHRAFKASKLLASESPNAWKYERFIFDYLPFTSKIKALLYPRELCFAPLKNFSGDDSPIQVQQALLHRDRQIFEEITKKTAPNTPFELDPAFYYPTPELISYLQQNPNPTSSYISGSSQ
jgi:UDP-N-acetylglucosamine/UDP-N-acetylgalactosamine diphosphorylase